MSRETLPILLVVQSEPPTADPDWAQNLTILRLAAIAEAEKLGWLPIFPRSAFDHPESREEIVEETILQAADAVLVVGDHRSNDRFHPGAQRLLERVAVLKLPVYGTHPTPHGYPPRVQLAAPPFFAEWTKAAVELRLATERDADGKWIVQEKPSWCCATCRRFFGSGEHAENLARWCCVKQQPCDACGALTDKTWIHCAACREQKDRERYAKRERRPAGNGMVYSDRDDEWFRDMDEAESRADDTVNENLAESDLVAEEEGRAADLESDEERKRLHPGRVRAELEDMRLLTSEPVFASPFELGDHVTDDLPDDNDSALDDLFAHVKDEVDALNAKLESAPPLSYSATDYAVDLDAPDEGPSDS